MSDPSLARQLIPTLSATLGAFSLGCALAWTSPALPNLESSECEDSCDIDGIDEDRASWISGTFNLFCIASGPVTGFLLNKIGRKWTMISYSVPLALGNILFCIAFLTEDDISIFVGRALTGFAGGAFALAAPLYIVEIASPDKQGALASVMQLMTVTGIMYVDALYINEAVSWEIISATLVAFPILLAATMFFMPESPTYFMAKDDEESALQSLQQLRGSRYDCEQEMEELREEHRKEKERGSITLIDLLTERRYLFPLLVVIGLMFFQQFSGVNTVIFYTARIFEQAGSKIDSGLSTFLVAVAQVVGTLIAVLIVERFGRKILLVISDFCMSISIFTLGAYFYLEEHPNKFAPQTMEDLGWLPLVSLIIYIFTFSIGFGPLPWAINAEIHPPESKAFGSAIAFSFNWLCAFLVTFFERDMEEAMHTYGVYFFYGTVCAVGTLFVALVVPETKGKTHEDLRHIFDKHQRLTQNKCLHK